MNINGDRNWVEEVNITRNRKGNLLANRKWVTGKCNHQSVNTKGCTRTNENGENVQ